jgi:hypothetical protein
VKKMSDKTLVQRISEETMRFMRGKYVLDEVPGKYYDIDCLKFRQGKKTILSINIHEDHYDFQVIFGKTEREKFEIRRDEFPQSIIDLYDKAHTFHDGKWMLIRVDTLETLEAVKKMVLIKKKPNRKPFPKEQAIYGDCGHRCDLCVHYTGKTISEEFSKELQERVRRVYSLRPDGEFPPCNGCSDGGITGKSDCDQKKCAKDKGASRCMYCAEYYCGKATVGWKPVIEVRSISADDVTWAILPYVDGQYGN